MLLSVLYFCPGRGSRARMISSSACRSSFSSVSYLVALGVVSAFVASSGDRGPGREAASSSRSRMASMTASWRSFSVFASFRQLCLAMVYSADYPINSQEWLLQ